MTSGRRHYWQESMNMPHSLSAHECSYTLPSDNYRDFGLSGETEVGDLSLTWRKQRYSIPFMCGTAVESHGIRYRFWWIMTITKWRKQPPPPQRVFQPHTLKRATACYTKVTLKWQFFFHNAKDKAFWSIQKKSKFSFLFLGEGMTENSDRAL